MRDGKKGAESARPDAGGETARSQARVRRWRFEAGMLGPGEDRLAGEEPLEIRLRAAGGEERRIAVTMRTPGADRELALGFLFVEGILRQREEVVGVRVLEDPWGTAGEPSNVLAVEIAGETLPDLSHLERDFFTTSACGLCGRAGIENLRRVGLTAPGPGPAVTAEVLLALPRRLRKAQSLFAATGGLHAAALFHPSGDLLALREDIGRHNALDKLIGHAFEAGDLPLSESILLLSSRASFELVQKALAAGVPIVAAVSAPSSLAVELASEFGITLIGFLREGRFNLYTGRERIRDA